MTLINFLGQINNAPLMYRQGDVLIVRAKGLPDSKCAIALVDGKFILSSSEITGHMHWIPREDNANYWENEGQRYIEVPAVARVRHDEHATVYLPSGLYQQVFQVGACDSHEFDHQRKGKLLASIDGFGRLYSYPETDLCLLCVINTTPEKDGVRKECWVPVNPTYYNGAAGEHIHAAVASTWRVSPKSDQLFFSDWRTYAPLCET